jgi:hypothetical protein
MQSLFAAMLIYFRRVKKAPSGGRKGLKVVV